MDLRLATVLDCGEFLTSRSGSVILDEVTPVSFTWEAEWPPTAALEATEKNELRFLGRTVRSIVTILTELPISESHNPLNIFRARSL
jgi:hypothetical protein